MIRDSIINNSALFCFIGKTSYFYFKNIARFEGKAVNLIQNKLRPSHYFVNLLSIFILDNEVYLAFDIPPQKFAIDDNGCEGFILNKGLLHGSIYQLELCRMLSVTILFLHISTVHSID